LTANIFGDSGCAVEREEDGGFELGFGTLGLSFGYIEGEARPLA
jgi:hypothetical protein